MLLREGTFFVDYGAISLLKFIRDSEFYLCAIFGCSPFFESTGLLANSELPRDYEICEKKTSSFSSALISL